MNDEQPTLATAATLKATQIPGLVTIRATGKMPSPSHDVRFQDTPIAVFPPQYRLILIEPSEPGADVITPFEIETNFPADEEVDAVVIFDAVGKHEVPVDQARD